MTALARLSQTAMAPTAPLRKIAQELAEPREQIEATFVRVGACLSEGAGILNRVTRVFEALPAELESPQLVEASARLADVGLQARAISEQFAVELADLTQLVEVVAAAEHPIVALRRTIKMMSIVAINARVVAASIIGDSDDFDVFTTDIAQLSETATGTVQKFTTLYQQLATEVGRAAHQRGQFQTAHASSLSKLAANMDDALAAVVRQRAVSVTGSAETGRVSRQIVGRIGNAVMALQVGDATRQRIEHVEAGIHALCDLLDGDTLPDDDMDGAYGAIGGLQARQLAGAAQAFETDVAEASDALNDLSSDAGAIMSYSRSVYGESGGGAQAPLTALSGAVRDAAIVLLDCETERSKIEQVAGAVLQTVDALLTQVEAVREIEANMRLVSINAAVKCAQLGPRGAALNVIARQLRELTGETVAAAEGAMTSLQDAARLARSFGSAATGDASGRVGRLEHEATAALLLLQGVDQALAQALATLERDGLKAIALLGNAAEIFADQAAISESITDLHMRLFQHCPPPGDVTSKAATQAIDRLWAGYTMDSERSIHETFIGASPNLERAQAPVATAEDALDALFF